MGVWNIASNFQIDVLTEMRRELGLIQKINLEYLQVEDQLQEEYFKFISMSLFRGEASKNLKMALLTFV